MLTVAHLNKEESKVKVGCSLNCAVQLESVQSHVTPADGNPVSYRPSYGFSERDLQALGQAHTSPVPVPVAGGAWRKCLAWMEVSRHLAPGAYLIACRPADLRSASELVIVRNSTPSTAPIPPVLTLALRIDYPIRPPSLHTACAQLDSSR
ncbi:hypothetical protein MRS44_012411 [Fusarium solani]|uniref:uncharacterized protein n=1 Tax=Fusarium solani TaxID=169388 RepID=UPI0032C3F062|nr:hypothetical protein MRS44_012411 [Fusarium solani]